MDGKTQSVSGAHVKDPPPGAPAGRRQLIILGAGGHAKVVADAALAAGFQLLGFIDDRAADAPLPGFRVLGKTSDLREVLAACPGAETIVAIGDNRVRERLAALADDVCGHGFAVLCHPGSIVSSYAGLGAGTVCLAGAVVNAGARVGSHVILNTACSVDHDCSIGDLVHISPGAHLAGNVTVGTGSHIGTGAAVIPGLRIGAWAVVGAGAVVTRDVPAGVVVAGVPANELRGTE